MPGKRLKLDQDLILEHPNSVRKNKINQIKAMKCEKDTDYTNHLI